MPDIGAIMEIMRQAKVQMLREGKHQWDETYPALEHIETDILLGNGFVMESDLEIMAYGAVVYDGEPVYDHIYDGVWLSDDPYVVVHRLAVNDKFKRQGVAVTFMQEVSCQAMEKGMVSFRVDTNFDNIYMQRIFSRLGFSYCGRICYQSGERLAYQLIF